MLPRATARYPPQVGSQRVLHALPGRRNGFSLHRLNLPDYAPSPSVISPPPGRHQAEFLPGRAAEGRQPPAGHAGGTFQNSSPRTACCSSSSVRLGDYSSCFHNAIQTSLKSLRMLPASRTSSYSVYFSLKPAYILLIYDGAFPFAVHSSLVLVSK